MTFGVKVQAIECQEATIAKECLLVCINDNRADFSADCANTFIKFREALLPDFRAFTFIAGAL